MFNNMKYKIKAIIPRVLILCCSDNIIQPNSPNGMAGTPYNNIVPENRLSASYDAIKPGNNTTHLNHSDSIIKDTRMRDE